MSSPHYGFDISTTVQSIATKLKSKDHRIISRKCNAAVSRGSDPLIENIPQPFSKSSLSHDEGGQVPPDRPVD